MAFDPVRILPEAYRKQIFLFTIIIHVLVKNEKCLGGHILFKIIWYNPCITGVGMSFGPNII